MEAHWIRLLLLLLISQGLVSITCSSGNFKCTAGCCACTPGSFCPGDNVGYSCPDGSASGVDYSIACTACTSGFASISKTGCISNCGVGYYGDVSTNQCRKCANSYYSVDYGTSCYTCAAGFYILDATSSCSTPCPAGSFVFYTTAGIVMTKCPVNTYSAKGSITCIPCDTGFSSPIGSPSCTPICGDGLLVTGEQCDDCNAISNDGCSSSCQIETGFACSRTGANTCDTCLPICGDGKKVTSYEQCEDGNTTDGDGCDSTCHVETGYSCTGGTISSVDSCSCVCGDGKRMGPEECDDQNIGNGDGCNKNCIVEKGFKCKGGSPTSKDYCDEICGDGIVIYDTLENCDDGNFINGDGCSSICIVETGWTCSGGTPISPDICKTTCGDGVIAIGIEECDDGNTKNIDGCSTYCKLEDGFTCINDYSAAINTHCYEICGDGKKYGVNPCDDGNTKNGDGCSSTCIVEAGYECTGGTPTMRDTCIEICGDGKYFGGSECDDGNRINGDGCSSKCELEKCYECVGGSITSKDTCSLLYITPSISKISTDNTITISFSHVMNQTSITLNDLQVKIDSYYYIDYSWNATYIDSQTLKLNVNSKTVLEGGEKITLNFINYKAFRAPRGGCLTLNELSTKLNSNLIASIKVATSLSWFAQYTAYLGIVVTIILLIVGGGSTEMLWALLNAMQIISYLSLMTDYFPQHVRIMYQILKFTNLNLSFMSDIFMKMMPINISDPVPQNSLFSRNGIDSSLILSNCSSILLTLMLDFAIFVLAVICFKIPCFSIVKKLCGYIINLFLFNFILRFMIEGYLEICFGSFLNLYTFKHSSATEITSLVISFIFGIVYFLFPFMSFVLIYDNRRELHEENEAYIQRFGTMYEELTHDKGWEYLQFYPVFLLRRLAFVVLLILLQGYSELQCNIFIMSSFLMLVYSYFARPFKEQINNILVVVNELTLFFVSNLQLIFTTRSKERDLVDYTGWVMISLVCVNVLVNFGICISFNIKRKIEKVRQRRLKQKIIHNPNFIFDVNNVQKINQSGEESPNRNSIKHNSLLKSNTKSVEGINSWLHSRPTKRTKGQRFANFSSAIDKNYKSAFESK